MPTFGHKLRHERESRNTRIQDVSAQTHIGLQYLEALENNDFDALPGPRGFGKLYIRAYAKVLGFDPTSLIDAYEQERRKRFEADAVVPTVEPPRKKRIHYVPPPLKSAPPEPRAPVVPEPEAVAVAEVNEPAGTVVPETAEPEVVVVREVEKPTPQEIVDKSGTSRRLRILVLSLGALALLIVVVVALFPTQSPTPDGVGPVESAAILAQPEVTQEPENETESVQTKPVTAVSTPVAGMRVTESGVGTGVVEHSLVGERAQFVEGSIVFFFTRVLDGAPGKTLRHVWLHEGRVIQSRELSVGSAHWRTYSTKTVWGQGDWTVEARGDDDQVLARADFSCTGS